jgi:L-malate glycosyltransferase
MRILFFNYEYPPLGGGAANATSYILKEYSKIPDLRVDLVTSSVDFEYHLEKIGENVFIHRLPIGKNENNLHFQSEKDLVAYSLKAYFFAMKLIRELKKENKKYDLSHSFFTTPCGFISMLLKWQYRIPYVVSLRGSDVPGYSDRFPFFYFFLKPLFKLIWKQSDSVVAASAGLKDLALKTNLGQKIEIVANGINIDDFKPDLQKRPAEKFIITPGASRVTKRKGLEYLIQAIQKLAPKYPNLFLKIAGEGDEKENLERMVKNLGLEEKIEFLGRIAREETAPYYQEASIFVLPSLNEGMSNAMLEALATGLPLVATDTGGTKELVEDGENGFIIKMKDSDDIAEKIEKLFNDGGLRERMGAASRKKAETMSWEKAAKKYIEIYFKIKELTD